MGCIANLFKKKQVNKKPKSVNSGMCIAVPNRDIYGKYVLHFIGGRYYKMNSAKHIDL